MFTPFTTVCCRFKSVVRMWVFTVELKAHTPHGAICCSTPVFLSVTTEEQLQYLCLLHKWWLLIQISMTFIYISPIQQVFYPEVCFHWSSIVWDGFIKYVLKRLTFPYFTLDTINAVWLSKIT